jgi:hypothetical protein
MDDFGTNAVTYYLILPIVAIAAGLIAWAIIKAHVSPWKRAGLVAGGVFAFFGFVVAVGIVYYHTSLPFAGAFRFYAYSVLAPGQDKIASAKDPFQAADGYEGMIVEMRDVYKKDGQVRLVHSVTPGFGDYGAYVFVPGKWITVNQTDDVLTVREASQYFSGPGVTKTSLWWALTKDLYKAEYSVE